MTSSFVANSSGADVAVGAWRLKRLLECASASFTPIWNALARVLRNATIAALATGPVPAHIAIIMDGNRRFAKRHHMPTIEGHAKGWVSLENTLEWCLKLGIRTLSVYSFSIENFNRSPEEVAYLFALFVEKLELLMDKKELILQHRVRIVIVGAVKMLPLHVQAAAYRAERLTADNQGPTIAVFIPYTSTNEIDEACVKMRMDRDVSQPPQPRDPRQRRHARDSKSSSPPQHERDDDDDDDDDDLLLLGLRKNRRTTTTTTTSNGDSGGPAQTEFEQNLATYGLPPVDLLVRTSGVRRLSDFLLYQVTQRTKLCFVDASWPEFSFFDVLPALIDYSRENASADARKDEESDLVFPFDAAKYDPRVTAEGGVRE